MPYHLSQLRTLCRAHPLERKVVLVPSHQIGYNLGTALARAGTGWVNLELTTPDDLARRYAEGPLMAEGWTAVVADVELMLFEPLVRDILSQDDDGYFARITPTTGLVKSMLQTLRALRLAGVKADAMAAVAGAKRRPLERLLEAHAALLQAHRFFDQAALFDRARVVVPSRASARDETVYGVLDETPLPNLAYRFLQALAGNRWVRLGRPDYGLRVPEQMAAARFARVPFVDGAPFDAAAGGRLFTTGLTPADREAVRPRGAAGAEHEVKAALREVLGSGIALDTVELAYTTEDPYLTLLAAEAARHDLPVTFAAGVPVTLTRPGQSLLAFYRWMASGFDTAEIISPLRAGLLTFHRILPAGVALEPDRAAGMLLAARARVGRAPVLASLEHHERRLASGEDTRAAEEVSTLRRALALLFEEVPVGRSPVAVVARAGVRFLELFAPASGDRDQHAKEALTDRLETIAAGVDREDDAAAVALHLADLLAGHKVEAAVARPGHLYVVPLDRAGYAGREVTFVVGLDEASFPGGATEDPILLDDERRALSDHLARQRARPAEQVWQLVRAMGAAGGRVTLLASHRDAAGGRETYPSAAFQRIVEDLGYGERAPAIQVPTPPEQALDAGEALLGLREAGGLRELLDDRFAWLRRGAEACAARAAPALTRFDGVLGSPLPDLWRGEVDEASSATQIETLARCPYRYFLRYVLRIEPPDEPEGDASQWLDPRAFGSLLHNLFRDFMGTLQQRGERPDAGRHTDLLQALLWQHVEREKRHNPPPNEAALQADLHRLRRSARIFLQAETGREAEPAGFEVTFGRGRDGALDVAEPVTVALGQRLSLLLRGAIDRVDRDGDGYVIWDYKTGSMRTFEESNLLQHATHLQWALYAQAFEQILDMKGITARVRASGYFFTSDREHGRRISQAPPGAEFLGHTLQPVFDLAAGGALLHAQKTDQCRYCDYRRICADEQILPKHLSGIHEAMDPEEAPFLGALNRWLTED